MNRVPKFYKHSLILIITLSFILQSCKRDDIYYSLNDDTHGFLVFDAGKTFKLKNAETGEIINLTVTSKNISYMEQSSGESMVSFGVVPGKTYLETGTLNFSDNSNCYIGRIYATTDSTNKNLVNMDFAECFGEQHYQSHQYIVIVDVLGVEYQDAYLFPSGPNNLFYSKEKGILKIVDYAGVVKFSIVE